VLRADSQLLTGRLPNGLRYYIRANHEPPARAELRLVVNAGSVLEDDDQRGAAHFVEHMAFNGTTHFPKQALVDFLEHAGMRFGADINAYTSFDETVFMLTLPTDTAGVLATGVQILEDWAHGVTFDSMEVEKERGVVLEEWRLGRGAGSRMRDEQFPVLAAHSRYADRQPIGTRESILALRPSQLKRFYHDWYRPDLMAVVAVGDFDPQQVLKLIEAHFGPLGGPAAHRPRPKYRIPMNDQTTVSVVTDPEATRTMVSLYVKSEPRPWYTAADYRNWLVESLASGMLLDRLNERMDRPASPFLDVSSFLGRFLRPLSAYVLNVRVPEHGVERGLEQLLLEAERAQRYGFTATELERGKAELLRREEQQYAERDRMTSSSFAADYTSVFLYGGTPMSAGTEYALTRRLLPEITPAEVNAAVREWTRPANRVVLVSGPTRDAVRLPTVRTLQRIIQAAPDARVAAYTDSLSTAPLVRHPPPPGRIVAEQRFDSVGVTEWRLGNGVRVLLKPTDYREDEVLIAGRSSGGSSLLPDSDYNAAATA
jgi:zinc protease